MAEEHPDDDHLYNHDDLVALREDVVALSNNVKRNTEALNRSQTQQVATRRLARRANYNTTIALFAAFTSLVTSMVLAYVLKTQQEIVVQNCENGNGTRQVQRDLWNGLLDNPAKRNQTEVEEHNGEVFREYINEAFAARDCSDLDKEYRAPRFPRLLKERGN